MNTRVGSVEFDLVTAAAPERVRAALLDFSESRPDVWPGLEPSLFEVYAVAETSADVREGSRAPVGKIWARERYDWSDRNVVRWTVQESNFSVPGSYVAASITPGVDGGSTVHVTWNRRGSTVRGKLICRMIRMSHGKPVADSIRRGLAGLERRESRRSGHASNRGL